VAAVQSRFPVLSGPEGSRPAYPESGPFGQPLSPKGERDILFRKSPTRSLKAPALRSKNRARTRILSFCLNGQSWNSHRSGESEFRNMAYTNEKFYHRMVSGLPSAGGFSVFIITRIPLKMQAFQKFNIFFSFFLENWHF